MASSTLNFPLIIFLFLFSSPTLAQRAPFKPNTLVIPTQRDPTTNLHIIHIRKGTPQTSVPLLFDVNGALLWTTCDQNHTSSTYNTPFCRSTECSRAGVHHCRKCTSPSCHNNSCGVLITNPSTQQRAVGELAIDAVSIQSFEQSRWATIRRFLFACAPSTLLQGPLPQGVQGIAGLGHTPASLPLQLASHFGFHPQFSICLIEPTDKKGAILLGNIPANLRPRTLTYTPLTVGTNGQYYVQVKTLRINNQDLPLNTSSLLTTFSTTTSTTLHPSIYQPFIQFFEHEMVGVVRAPSVPPYELCFNRRFLPPTRVGVPRIEFIFQERSVNWTVYGYDALVYPRDDTFCVGVVNGGLNSNARAPITIGTNFMQENIFQFDLVRSRLGVVPVRLLDFVDCEKFSVKATELTLELQDEMES